MDVKKIMKKVSGASTGLAVAVAFFNTALLVAELVKTVTEEVPKLDSMQEEPEDNGPDKE